MFERDGPYLQPKPQSRHVCSFCVLCESIAKEQGLTDTDREMWGRHLTKVHGWQPEISV